MHGRSSFQGKVRVIAISLSIILILGGCSSSLAGKEKSEEPQDPQETTVSEETNETGTAQETAAETGTEKEQEAAVEASLADSTADATSGDQSTSGVSEMTTGADAALFLMGDDGQASESEYNPATYAITGGTWDILESGEKIYTMADGNQAKNVWVEDDGMYYYVDFTGCLMKNNYTADGFWVGEKGYWDRSKKQRKDDVEPLSGKPYGDGTVMTIDIINYSDDATYAKATLTYSFGSKEEYNVMPLGNSTYLLEYKDDFYTGLLMSVSEDRKTLIVSGLGCTDTYTMAQ
jgi:hypothetical protein